MPVQIGDEVEIPEGGAWVRVRIVRRGEDDERLEKPSLSGGAPLRVPVWIVEYARGPRAGEQVAVPNGTIVKIPL